MKHWFLFYSEYYYPAGGMDDFVSAHETYEEAVAAREAALEVEGGGMEIDWEPKLDEID